MANRVETFSDWLDKKMLEGVQMALVKKSDVVSVDDVNKRFESPRANLNVVNKDGRILWQGIYQAALQSPVLGMFPLESHEAYLQLLSKTVKHIVQEIRTNAV